MSAIGGSIKAGESGSLSQFCLPGFSRSSAAGEAGVAQIKKYTWEKNLSKLYSRLVNKTEVDKSASKSKLGRDKCYNEKLSTLISHFESCVVEDRQYFLSLLLHAENRQRKERLHLADLLVLSGHAHSSILVKAANDALLALRREYLIKLELERETRYWRLTNTGRRAAEKYQTWPQGSKGGLRPPSWEGLSFLIEETRGIEIVESRAGSKRAAVAEQFRNNLFYQDQWKARAA